MRTPDYGGGDWQEKVCRNNTLTEVTAIGLRGDEVYIELSSKADSIKFIGQNHSTLHLSLDSDRASMVLAEDEPYVRITAYLPAGETVQGL